MKPTTQWVTKWRTMGNRVGKWYFDVTQSHWENTNFIIQNLSFILDFQIYYMNLFRSGYTIENWKKKVTISLLFHFIVFCIYFTFYLLCAGHTCMQQCMCRGQRTTCRRHSALPCGSQNQYQVIGLNGKHFYSLSHLIGPSFPSYAFSLFS